MAIRLSDSELATRTREANRRRGERHRQRLTIAGKSALTVWLPDTVRKALTTKAANDGATIADTAAALLSAALEIRPGRTESAPATPPPSPAVDSLPLCNDPAPSLCNDPAPSLADTAPPITSIVTSDRDQQIVELHRQGLSGYAIADRVGCSEPTVRRVLKRAQTKEATV